jgi:predicted dienelactone hydrolase
MKPFALLTILLTSLSSPGAIKNEVEVLRDVWHDPARERNVPVKIYSPNAGYAPFPVIIFSHGLG